MCTNGGLALVIQQPSEHSCLVHVTFHIPKDCLHFPSAPPPPPPPLSLSSFALNTPSVPGFHYVAFFLILPSHV